MAAKYQKKKIQDENNSGFGKYREDTGGGHPFEKGNSNTRTTKENGKIRKDENNSSQPRTDDGKFTYNSVNGKDIKYGEKSRGKTVNPLLTGGENGIKIDDVVDKDGNLKEEGVKTQFKNQSGEYWDKYKDKWYQKGGEMVLPTGKKFTTRVSSDAIWDVARRKYNVSKGEFTGESKVFDESKKGGASLDEKAAKQKAQQTGEEQAVIDSNTGGIKVKGGQPAPVKPEPAQPAVEPEKTPVVPTVPQEKQPEQPAVAPAPAPAEPAAPKQTGVKYGEEEVETIKNWFRNKFADSPEKVNALIQKIESMSPEQLDKQIDMWLSKGTDFGLNKKEETQAQPVDTDSDAIKKIKGMGFNG